jgi:DNA polymerase-3 subunit epsilon
LSEKEEAIQRAKSIVAQNPVYLDTETTGLGLDAEIVEIAIVGSRGETVFYSFVRPRIRIPKAATRIHGIRNEDVEGAPSFISLYPAVAEIFQRNKVVIYNAEYDLRVMRQSLSGIENPDLHASCAMKLYARFYGDWDPFHRDYRWQKLENAARQCSIEVPRGMHTAKVDAKLTLGIMDHMSRFELAHVIHTSSIRLEGDRYASQD